MTVNVVAVLTVRGGMEERAKGLVTGLAAPTHAEEGCLLYAVQWGVDEGPQRLGFVEQWASVDLLEAHLASQHVAEFGAQADECFSSIEIYRFTGLEAGDPAKGTLQPGA